MRVHHLARMGIVGVAAAASAWLWDRVPDPMPIHWGLDGRPDAWAPRAIGMLLLPIVALVLPTVISRLASRDRALEDVTRLALERTMTAITAFLAATHALVLDAALADDQVIRLDAMAALLGALVIVLGVEMPRTSPNRWIGVRTRATMTNEATWRVVHRLTGRAFVVSGAIAIVGASLLPPTRAILLAIASLLLASVASALVAWAVARSRPSP